MARSKLTIAAVEAFSGAIRGGGTLDDAAGRVGVTGKTAMKWAQRGRAELTEDPESVSVYARFAKAYDQAKEDRSEGKMSESELVAVVERSARSGSAKAAQWLLERRFPKRWASPSVQAAQTATGAPDPHAAPGSVVDQLAARRRGSKG